MKHNDLLHACLMFAALSLVAFGSSSIQESSTAVPSWFREHLASQMAGGGRTVADNSEYRSETEPYDAYGVEWKWGLGKQSIRGRLFGLIDGVEAGDFWELHTFWHPGRKEATVHQFGADGTYATGWLRELGSDMTETEQVFYAPDGSERKIRHETRELKNGGHEGGSFSWDGTAWKLDRFYRWLPEAGDDSEE